MKQFNILYKQQASKIIYFKFPNTEARKWQPLKLKIPFCLKYLFWVGFIERKLFVGQTSLKKIPLKLKKKQMFERRIVTF